MRCEVIAIGTELLLGQIVDTNSTWIGEQLARIGVDSHYCVKVGDNFERIAACLRLALDRSDAVVCCGGLGPTQDDITREVIAAVMDVPLDRDPDLVRRITALFAARGRKMTENNLRQANLPRGAAAIPEMPGTAPGLVCPVGDKVIYAVPGVPFEMRIMFERCVLPDMRRRSGRGAVIRSRVLRTWGHGEAGLAEVLADRVAALDEAGNPTLAFLASGVEGIKVRITAKAGDEVEAERMIADEEARVRELLGEAVFGVDDQSMERIVLDRLRASGRTLAACEELTGGLATARLTAVDPEMRTFLGGWTQPFAPRADAVPGETRALEAARKVRGAYGADIGIAALLPTARDRAPPGTVVMAFAAAHEERTARTTLPGDRQRVREYAVINLLNLLRRRL